MRPVPVKYVYHGDRQQCDALRGQANRVMHILETIMSTGNLQQNLIRFVPYDGALIVAHKYFGTRVIDIYAGVHPPIPTEQLPRICICNCNLSFGWILEVQIDLIGSAQLYTVMACNYDGTAYVPYEDVLASDFTVYEVGQKVLMVPYKEMAYLCCTDKTGGGDKVRGCTPYNIDDSIVKSDSTWRTNYRILPWCALTVPVDLLPSEWNTNG